MISRLILPGEGKEFKNSCGNFMLVRVTGQYTVCEDNKSLITKSHSFFTIYNIIK